jgi:two-component system, LuxR family, response regulator FixJ
MRGCPGSFSMGGVKPPSQEHPVVAAAQSAPEKSVIVIVDDDFAVRNSLAFALTEEGFLVRIYCSAEMLLDDARLGDARCLVIDQKLPGLSGLDLVDELRRRDVSAPVILITTGPTAQIRRAAAAAGIAIVEKPLIGDALFHEIQLNLARSSAPRGAGG